MNRLTAPSQQSKLSKKLVPTSLILLGIVLVVLMPLAIWVAYGPMTNQTSTKAIGSSNNIVFPLMSAGLMTTFSIAVLNRYLSSKKMYFFFWGTGLLMFSMVSLSEIYLSIQWNRWAFFSWYFFGAVLNAAWIGQGTIYLLFSRKWVRFTVPVLLFGSLAALIIMLQTMPMLDVSKFSNNIAISEQYRDIMPTPSKGGVIRLLTPIFNIYGAIALIGGAVWSAYLFWRKKVLPNRVIGNILIAIGATIVSAASILTRMGYGNWWYLGELLSATLLFAGFILASRKTYIQFAHREVKLVSNTSNNYINE
ncbi:MAG: hypothetical protein CL606_08000 [Anaerolineaceae bacterium]|nr:hypothetical protein [Anaerolineaceae bacterium]|tara:strand:- start:77958 stop:78881 length:924 start_codon:yes stop_codon:yes gene_type:complete